MSLEDKIYFVLHKSFHLENIRNARKTVLFWKEFAEKNPDKVLFVSVDRMDQLKTMMPNWFRFSSL
jgi:hypothetical protein